MLLMQKSGIIQKHSFNLQFTLKRLWLKHSFHNQRQSSSTQAAKFTGVQYVQIVKWRTEVINGIFGSSPQKEDSVANCAQVTEQKPRRRYSTDLWQIPIE